MNEEVLANLKRAETAIRSAETLVAIDPDGAVNRAYYAAFYAVSALFLREGNSFRKHTAVQSAVHRDLVRTGRWPVRLGELYSSLMDLRNTGDYGVTQNVTEVQASEATSAAAEILAAVRNELT